VLCAADDHRPIEPRRADGYWASRIEEFLGGCLRDRDILPAGRALDVLFRDFTDDELGTLRLIYELAGQPFTERARAAAQAYLAGHRGGRHGSVDYRLDDLGLSAAQRRQALARHADRFGIREEPGLGNLRR
jgi:hypothetical protein